MDDKFTYDADFLVWTEQQAQALRALAKNRADLPNELDLEHVAEEIEDMGRSELNAVKSQIRNILVHLIKLASTPEAPAHLHWQSEVVVFHIAMHDRLTPAMHQRLALNDIWKQALRIASADLRAFGETILPGLDGPCPYCLADLLSPEVDPESLASRLASRARGAPDH